MSEFSQFDQANQFGEFSQFQETSSILSASSVHQIVFRWEGNQGRQGTGMKAVAHSCPPERAERLGRELGPLLWVSGPGAARPSVVRTLSHDGEVLLVRRWPTTDRAGRPSTASHVLTGTPATLNMRRCLGLAYGGWSSLEFAERATGPKSVIDCAHLADIAYERLPKMEARLESVRGALMMATAEWLRDPAQRVSLLVGEERPTGWPTQDEASLVYLGLFLLFDDWPGHDWTFATYDTVDTHPLRLTAVPRWEQDTGGSGPLARVMGGRAAEARFEHRAASRLVDHLLAHRGAPPGVPQLTKELRGGATMDWERRRDLLQRILRTEHRPGAPRTETPKARPPQERPSQEPPPTERRHEREKPQPQPDPGPAPQPPSTYQLHRHHQLHDDLRGDERGGQVEHRILMAQLQKAPDDVLLHELLQSDELPPRSVELLLSELGNPQRRETRPRQMQQDLCAQVLRNHLYLTPHGQTGESMSGTALADRAAHLFSWAVAPLAREEEYLHDLHEMLYTMVRAPHPVWTNWLSRTLVSPTNGEVPDLPPKVWQQILRDVLLRTAGSQPTALPPPITTTPQSPTPLSGLAKLTSDVGCVIGACVTTMIVVLIAIVVIAM
ncbi:hypothetical protein ACKI1I_02075 [Streptomyces turgidiscabies]|uniref:Uncharacterized protein n=1 Tax=Streptomyces turgidiscabies (strain Car8) TaxID=698760 RepID=L7F021_STRT8|nr:hypothetical protein [Streptomyces turgidiscabies]ELP64489.1 hypothetical protein STRTUCAR8_05367 [Streptomyces turgidiscabies Car8]MDX3492315.1 hypothetical protein [Streptomyces turgidiscabies]GAQ69393.1 hypothetical protein T45_01117 [Streptomyces turgidiscabies]